MIKKVIFMLKNKTIIIVLLIYLLFVSAVSIGYIYIRYNSIDKIAMTYIWENGNIENQYGEIKSVTRYHGYKIQKKDTGKKVAYSVKTEDYKVIIYVYLNKIDNNWDVDSIEFSEIEEVD